MRTDSLWTDKAGMNGHSYELIVDSFAGGGGASVGIEAAVGRRIDIAINHDPRAIALHEANHPGTLHFAENIWKIDPVTATRGRAVGMLWASPDCTHFSAAKGGRPVSKQIRGLAWVAVKWAAAVRPRVIFLENVREFLTWGPVDKSGKVVAARKGQTFRRWVRQLRALGYEVEWKLLNAADYGAPTSRRRLFLVARCDGRAIAWPEPSHGPGRSQPYHTAAECIDWTLPCPSIFERRRSLAENTLQRIARGLRKYVIEAEEPFIVTCNHGGEGFRGQGLREPMRTITAARDAHGLVVPFLSKYHGLKGGESRCSGLRAGVPTLDTSNRFALVSAFLDKHYGGTRIGRPATEPLSTITARSTQNQLVAAYLSPFYGASTGQDVRQPMPTMTGCNHVAEVRAFLVKYYGTGGQDQAADEPLHTITAKARFGLVTVKDVEYQIVDIGLRMLTPAELLRAQFGRFADGYKLIGSKTQQIAAIGNSVCPENAEVVVLANYRPQVAQTAEATA